MMPRERTTCTPSHDAQSKSLTYFAGLGEAPSLGAHHLRTGLCGVQRTPSPPRRLVCSSVHTRGQDSSGCRAFGTREAAPGTAEANPPAVMVSSLCASAGIQRCLRDGCPAVQTRIAPFEAASAALGARPHISAKGRQ
jgi:hypothetical protein